MSESLSACSHPHELSVHTVWWSDSTSEGCSHTHKKKKEKKTSARTIISGSVFKSKYPKEREGEKVSMHNTWRRYIAAAAAARRWLWARARTRTDSLVSVSSSAPTQSRTHSQPPGTETRFNRLNKPKQTKKKNPRRIAAFLPMQTVFVSCDQPHSRAFRGSVSSAQVTG